LNEAKACPQHRLMDNYCRSMNSYDALDKPLTCLIKLKPESKKQAPQYFTLHGKFLNQVFKILPKNKVYNKVVNSVSFPSLQPSQLKIDI
jgi:hypothetical protein